MTRNGGGFVVESALYELLRYASKYNQQITSNLRLSGLEAKAQLFDGIEDIHNLPKCQRTTCEATLSSSQW